MKPRVYSVSWPKGRCWHISLDGQAPNGFGPCYMTWWDAYHDALYVYARKATS